MTMEIQSTVPVTHMDLNQLSQGGSTQGIVKMQIRDRQLVIRQDEVGNWCAYIEVLYTYKDAQGRTLPTNDGGRFVIEDTLENPNIVSNTLNSVSSLLTASKNSVLIFNQSVLHVARFKFAERYNIQINQVQEI